MIGTRNRVGRRKRKRTSGAAVRILGAAVEAVEVGRVIIIAGRRAKAAKTGELVVGSQTKALVEINSKRRRNNSRSKRRGSVPRRR